MKAVYIPRYGGPEALELREGADPEPKAGEVRVRSKAAGVNFADLVMRLGQYVGAPPLPFIPGYEAAGVVDKVVSSSTSLRPGDRVYAALPFGGYADTFIAKAERLLPIPEGKGFEEAAALPVNYLTAYHALYVLGSLRSGARVLIHGGAGGVGLAAIQLAALLGAEIYATASEGKHAFLKERGVKACIDPRKEDLERRIMELSGGKGMHLILDPVGGSSFRLGYRCLAPAGMLVCYGISSAAPGGRRSRFKEYASYLRSGLFSPLDLMLKNRAVAGFHLGLLMDEALLAEEMKAVHQLWASGKIAPHVGAAFPAAKASEAHQYIHDRKNVGKVVLTWP